MHLQTLPRRLPLRPALVLSSLIAAACGGGGGAATDGPGPPAPVVKTFDNFQASSFVIGQLGYDATERNQGQGPVPSDSSLAFPEGMVITPEGRLLVADTGNHRVLVFPSVPGGSTPQADDVLGQAGFESAAPVLSREGLVQPIGVSVGQGQLAIADFGNNRVLLQNWPAADALPHRVIGQPNFETSTPDCSATGLAQPAAVAITPAGKLIVADMGNNRVLVWDRIAAPGLPMPAPLVLGQQDAEHCAPDDDDQDHQGDNVDGEPVPTARTLSWPADVWSDDERLVVADMLNNRVLIWNHFPTRSFQPADLVLGHSTFTNASMNREHDGGPIQTSARTLAAPMGVHSDGTSLVVADALNRRVLVWNRFPSRSFEAPDAVIGQANFEDGLEEAQSGAPVPPTGRTFAEPRRVLLTSQALLVADTMRHRILAFRRLDAR